MFALVDRTLTSTGQGPDGPLQLSEPGLRRLADQAVDLVRTMANSSPAAQGQLLPAHLAEALYLRASLEASGSFPSVFPASPCDAFRDFEASAGAGYAPACDYESVGDAARARDCFERSVRGCFYRIGLAHFQGQLGITPPNPQTARGPLQRAAVLGEFPAARVPPHILAHILPAGSSAILEARKCLERSAYLSFAPAQSKLASRTSTPRRRLSLTR